MELPNCGIDVPDAGSDSPNMSVDSTIWESTNRLPRSDTPFPGRTHGMSRSGCASRRLTSSAARVTRMYPGQSPETVDGSPEGRASTAFYAETAGTTGNFPDRFCGVRARRATSPDNFSEGGPGIRLASGKPLGQRTTTGREWRECELRLNRSMQQWLRTHRLVCSTRVSREGACSVCER
jgi:hypothetical protein